MVLMKPNLFETEEKRTISVLKNIYESNAMDEIFSVPRIPLKGKVINTYDLSGIPSHLNFEVPKDINYVVEYGSFPFQLNDYFMTKEEAEEYKSSLDVYYETVPEGTKPIRSKKKRHYKKWFNKHKVTKVFNNATISKIISGDDNNDSNNGTVEITLP